MKFLILITLALTLTFAKDATVEQLFSVQSVKVQQNRHSKSIKSYGYVRADQSRIYDVAPRFGGFVEVLYADKLYKRVKKGEALAKVYSPEVLKAKEEYKNSLNYSKNKTMIESAKTKLKLLDIPDSEINSKTSNYTTIISPAEGYVFKKSLNNNSAFNAKNVIFEIVDLDTVWVEVKIHQEQLNQVEKIDNFILTTPALKQRFKATKGSIYPVLDESEESFTLRLELKNTDTLLKPGMYMSVEMNHSSESYLTLPTTAVIRKNNTFYVFAHGEYEGEYEPREVDVDVLDSNTYIIKSGLDEGDSVVNNALFMMDSDAQINGLY